MSVCPSLCLSHADITSKLLYRSSPPGSGRFVVLIFLGRHNIPAVITHSTGTFNTSGIWGRNYPRRYYNAAGGRGPWRPKRDRLKMFSALGCFLIFMLILQEHCKDPSGPLHVYHSSGSRHRRRPDPRFLQRGAKFKVPPLAGYQNIHSFIHSFIHSLWTHAQRCVHVIFCRCFFYFFFMRALVGETAERIFTKLSYVVDIRCYLRTY